MKIGILADLHLGVSEPRAWHNRQMHADAEGIARAAAAQLRGHGVDRALVLGDVTEAGRDAELRAAAGVFAGLVAPCRVIPGNHDRPAVASGAFDRVLAPYVPPVYERAGRAGFLFVREAWPPPANGAGASGPSLDERGLDAAIDAITTDAPALLIVCSHFPLLPCDGHARAHGAKYGGHFPGGGALFRRLRAACRGRQLLFCGHQHWHQFAGPSAGRSSVAEETGHAEPVQCATAALIEYPMEVRVLTVEPDAARVVTLPTASPDSARRSLVEGGGWVRGDAGDRDFTLALP